MYSGSESDREQGNIPLAMFGILDSISDNLQVNQSPRPVWRFLVRAHISQEYFDNSASLLID